jgi:hypothetical protein
MPPETGPAGPLRREVSDSAVRAQLERILTSAVFSRSQQLRRLLTFLVEQTLTGQGPTLQEAVLAHEVYGKGPDFDGGTDPVVRVDARRLRDKLREYYEGRSDPVLISLPKGSYVPVFEAGVPSPVEATAPTTPGAPQAKRAISDLTRITLWAGALAVVVVVVTTAIAWHARSGGRDTSSVTASGRRDTPAYPGRATPLERPRPDP